MSETHFLYFLMQEASGSPSCSIFPSCSQTLFGNTHVRETLFPDETRNRVSRQLYSQTISSCKWGRVWEQDAPGRCSHVNRTEPDAEKMPFSDKHMYKNLWSGTYSIQRMKPNISLTNERLPGQSLRGSFPKQSLEYFRKDCFGKKTSLAMTNTRIYYYKPS